MALIPTFTSSTSNQIISHINKYYNNTEKLLCNGHAIKYSNEPLHLVYHDPKTRLISFELK